MEIGDRIKKLRKNHGYTKNDVANAMGISVKTLNSWEKNQMLPNMEEIKTIANHFGITPNEVMNGIDIEENDSKLPNGNIPNIRYTFNKINNFYKIFSAIFIIVFISIFACAFIFIFTVNKNINQDPIITNNSTNDIYIKCYTYNSYKTYIVSVYSNNIIIDYNDILIDSIIKENNIEDYDTLFKELNEYYQQLDGYCETY